MLPPLQNPVDLVRARVAGSIRHLVAGNSTPPPPPSAGEGFLPDDAVARRVHADPSMFVGGLRALLLQTLHPLAMAGVAEHSDYRRDPWGRLRRTAGFVGTTTFGSREEAEAAIAQVRRIHQRVRGVAPDGRPYAATDPRLLAWVHATEVDSFLRAYQRYGAATLDPAHSDRYVAEMAGVADRLGADPVPRSVAELDEVLASFRPELRAGSQARGAVLFLLVPPVSLAVRPVYSLVSAAAIGLLPGWAQRALWLAPPPLGDPLVVRPATRALLGALGWALEAR
jgi:uncharacterized protein (DUF2236 family)